MLPLLALLAAAPLLAGTPPAPASSMALTVKDGEKLVARWPDAKGAPQALTATFPPGTLTAAVPWHFEEPALMTLLGERLQAWATETRPGAVVTVAGAQVTMKSPRATDAAGEARENEAVAAKRAEVHAALLAEHHLGVVGPGVLQYDHARIAADNVAALKPLVDALGPAEDTRVFAAKALAFVQSIPAEDLTRDTFAPPLAVLHEQHGDCDEKATLYAALIRAVAPELPVAVLTMKAHAVVGLGLTPAVGDRTVTVEGMTWVFADPAGPALHDLGRIGPKTDLVQLSVRRVP